MIVVDWVLEKLAPRPPHDDKYERAIALTDEVTEKMRERAASPDPFRSLMADLFMQHHDIALVADAFEVAQESRIYQGRSPK
jgi:hypothetical protein